MDRALGKGWRPYNFQTKDDVKLQTYEKGPAQEHEKLITISVNHFPLKNFQLPENIYHYETVMDRVREPRPDDKKDSQKPEESKGQQGKKKKSPTKSAGSGRGPEPGSSQAGGALPPRKLPKPLPQLVLQVLMARLREQMKHHGIVSDLSNNIYSMKKLEGKVELVQDVCLSEVDQTILQETDTGIIRVTITPTDLRIDTSAMAAYLNSKKTWKGMAMDIATKTTTEQVYNAIVKSMPNFRYLPQGRSNLVTWPVGGGVPLGDGVMCWKGLSANIGMGWKPYLNVDRKNSELLYTKNNNSFSWLKF